MSGQRPGAGAGTGAGAGPGRGELGGRSQSAPELRRERSAQRRGAQVRPGGLPGGPLAVVAVPMARSMPPQCPIPAPGHLAGPPAAGGRLAGVWQSPRGSGATWRGLCPRAGRGEKV